MVSLTCLNKRWKILFAGPLADFINNRVVPKVDDVSDAAIRYKLRQSSSPYPGYRMGESRGR